VGDFRDTLKENQKINGKNAKKTRRFNPSFAKAGLAMVA